MKLVIFDLDQTLVELIMVHDAAAEELFRKNYWKSSRFTDIDYAGRSLTASFVEMAKARGMDISKVQLDAPRLLGEYEALFARMIPADASRSILPGAKELLENLSRRGHFVALYTGDTRAVAEAILKSTGLGRYMRTTVFSDDAPTRSGMLRLVMERAGKICGRDFAGRDIVVIGDSTRDVDAGKEVGALTIAVATGHHSRQVLTASGPDYLFDDLSDHAAVFQAVTGK